MVHCIVGKNIILQFHETGNGDLFPRLIQGDYIRDLPLLVVEHDILPITHKLKLINFYNLPYKYIEKVILGCIIIVLKRSRKK
jgi:hypothetical protein